MPNKDGGSVVCRGGEVVKIPCMAHTTRTRVRLDVDGLAGIHAVRAVWTALGAVPGVVSADVSMAGVVLEVEGALDRVQLTEMLAAAGVTLRAISVEQRAILPLA